MKSARNLWSGALFAAGCWCACAADPAAEAFPPQPPAPYFSPDESRKHFQLPPGYRLELVVAEPVIREPVITVFDGNGRMFVAEMRTYMQDIDGSKTRERVSRVSMHWSSRGDGRFDRHTVFIDQLMLPRILLPLADGLLVGETDTNDLFLYRDTDGDGVADQKQPWFLGGPRGGNLEHQPSGLIWAMDNWLYTTYNAYRLRPQGTNILKEPTAPNGGQWGLTQDDHGKPWYVNAGGERGPLNFQQHILYGDFNVRDQFVGRYAEVWPAVPIPDVQGGLGRFRPQEKTLNHFTATCGAEIFRGDRLPADLRGDLLFAEPVGRLIRRTKIEVRDGVTFLSNPYEAQKTEFIRSTDPNFRPVNLATAPDGTLYITDMYRGIIQEGNWVRPGSYLRNVVQQYQLDKNFGRGRIWRLVHQDFQPGPPPRMQSEKPAQLVAHLEHPNGWWRDTAQKLLVLRADRSVVPALEELARASGNHLARMHALWTLEGLGALDATHVRDRLKDSSPPVRSAAIRASETLFKQGGQSLMAEVLALARDPDPNVSAQVLLTANLLKWPDAKPLLQSLTTTNAPRGVRELGLQLLAPAVTLGEEFTAAEKSLITQGEAIYKELCFACHAPDGKGTPVEGAKPGTTLGPSLVGSRTVVGNRDGVIAVMLHGLTGPLDGKTYEALMVPMASNDDRWIAAVSSYIRHSFGNHASVIEPASVTAFRAATKGRTEPWTIEELRATLPQPLPNRTAWKLTASHKPDTARAAVDGNLNSRYDTGTSQVPGMWFQIELPQETLISGVQLDAGNSTRDYPRGYQVELSPDGQAWTKPVASGQGHSPLTDISFLPARAKFIRITQTGSVNGLFWSIHELQVFTKSDMLPVRTAAPARPAAAGFQ